MDARFRIMRATVPEPERASRTAAGWDLRAAAYARVEPQDRYCVPTGVGVHLAPDEVGLVCPRSGLALHHGLTVLNAPGVIDPDYGGEIQVVLQNHNGYPVGVAAGDRIAQLLIVPLAAAPTAVPPTAVARGAAGFGSTGR